MKVLLTGAAGQLGQALRQQQLAGIELIATSRRERLTMLRLHRERGASGEALGVVEDQVGCPTSTATLAAACWRVITAIVQEPVLHWCDAGAASWFDVAVAVGELAQHLPAGGGGKSSTHGSGLRLAKQLSHLRAVEQAQQSLEFAAVGCGGVELEGKSASIKSSSECIQSSNASSLSSCILRCSAAGSRRQLSIRKNERKGDSDEPDTPLLGETESFSWEVDVVIGRKESDQANDTANDGLQQSFAIKPQPPPGRRRIQIPKNLFHPRQPRTTRVNTILVHPYCPVS